MADGATMMSASDETVARPVARLGVAAVQTTGADGLAVATPREAERNARVALRLAPILTLAVYFGLACGVAEGLAAVLTSVVPDGFGWKNDLLPPILLIAPLFNMWLFVTAGCVLALALRVVPGRHSDLPAWAVFAWLAVYGPLAALGRLHTLTCMLLAAG